MSANIQLKAMILAGVAGMASLTGSCGLKGDLYLAEQEVAAPATDQEEDEKNQRLPQPGAEDRSAPPADQ